MTLPMLLGFDTVRDGNSVADIIARYTCPLDGYVHAWVDNVDPTLVYVQPTCPVDAPKALLIAQIAQFVTIAYNATDETLDPHDRLMEMIAGVSGVAVTWVGTHTVPAVAAFLSDQTIIHKLIVAELKTQGILQ